MKSHDYLEPGVFKFLCFRQQRFRKAAIFKILRHSVDRALVFASGSVSQTSYCCLFSGEFDLAKIKQGYLATLKFPDLA